MALRRYEVSLTFRDPSDDDQATSEAVESLVEELQQLDFHKLEALPSGPAPVGTRGIDAVTAGSLIGVLSSPLVLKAAIDVIKSWLTRRDRGTVSITIGQDSINLSAASSAEQARLVNSFIEAHAPS